MAFSQGFSQMLAAMLTFLVRVILGLSSVLTLTLMSAFSELMKSCRAATTHAMYQLGFKVAMTTPDRLAKRIQLEVCLIWSGTVFVRNGDKRIAFSV